MTPPIDPKVPSSNDIDGGDANTITNLTVQGTLPVGLSGRLLGIGPDSGADSGSSGIGSLGTGDGAVHSVHLHAGLAISYRSRWVRTDNIAPKPRTI